MPIRYISKGKGKKRKVIPIRQTKGVTVRSVSLKPTAIQKVNKEQGKLLNRGETANFSKALNSVIMRAKRDKDMLISEFNQDIPLQIDFDQNAKLEYKERPRGDWHKLDPYTFRSWGGQRRINGKPFFGNVYYLGSNIISRPKGVTHEQHIKNLFRERKEKDQEIKKKLPNNVVKGIKEDFHATDIEVDHFNPEWNLYEVYADEDRYFIFPDEKSAIKFGRQSIRDTASEYIPDKESPEYDEWKNLSDDELVDKIIEEQSDYGQRSELGALAQSISGYDGQYHTLPDGWIAFQID